MHIRKTWRATQIWSVFYWKSRKTARKSTLKKIRLQGPSEPMCLRMCSVLRSSNFSDGIVPAPCGSGAWLGALQKLTCGFNASIFDWHMLLTNQETVGRATGACHPHQIGLCVITSSVYEVQQVFQEDTSCAKPPWEIPHNPFFAPPCEQDFEEHWRKPRGLKVKRQARLENIRKKHLCSAQSILVG